MNSISWFLYFADVVGRVSFASAPMAFFGLFGVIFGTGILMAVNHDARYEKKPENIWSPRYFILIWVIWVFVFLVAMLTPSKETLYMIAGSEITETVVNTPEAKEILDETRKAILSQIKELQK